MSCVETLHGNTAIVSVDIDRCRDITLECIIGDSVTSTALTVLELILNGCFEVEGFDKSSFTQHLNRSDVQP